MGQLIVFYNRKRKILLLAGGPDNFSPETIDKTDTVGHKDNEGASWTIHRKNSSESMLREFHRLRRLLHGQRSDGTCKPDHNFTNDSVLLKVKIKTLIIKIQK